MTEERPRLDVLLARRGLAPSRHRAQALILAGRVRVDGERVAKAGTRVDPRARLEVEEPEIPWVSRGGVKLRNALDAFGTDPAGRVALDIGASTGGFTHVLLEAGARLVVAVDVGYGQLDYTLRGDPRVRVMERCNARHLTPDDLPADLPARPDLAVVDVSFISLRKVLPAVAACLAPAAEILALAKPQFEAGPDRVGKGGVVRDPSVHREVLAGLLEWVEATRRPGAPSDGRGIDTREDDFRQGTDPEGPPLWVRGLVPSGLPGASGNREFFLWLVREGPGLDAGRQQRALERCLGREDPAPQAPCGDERPDGSRGSDDAPGGTGT